MEYTEQINQAANIIRNGGVVAFPTETVYGLGASAFNEKAVARVFEIKRRPYFDPLILHVGGIDWLDNLVTDIPELATVLIDRLWPGPLTVVLPKKPAVPDIATSGLPGAAVRMPSNDVARRLIAAAGVPIAAPSANLFGCVSPTTAAHVRDGLGGAVDMLIDGGECAVGIESTIISFMNCAPLLLRPGGAPLEDIEAVIGKVTIPANDEFADQSPGRSGKHYATSTPLALVRDIDEIADIEFIKYINNIDNITYNNTNNIYDNVKIGLLAFAPLDSVNSGNLPSNIVKTEYLSKNGDLREAACNLFAAMRRLDESDVDIIAALPVPNKGLGLAINDRLRRAARK
jgi:L-threonylcarbamoyladenylate synthase